MNQALLNNLTLEEKERWGLGDTQLIGELRSLEVANDDLHERMEFIEDGHERGFDDAVSLFRLELEDLLDKDVLIKVIETVEAQYGD